MGRVVGDEFRGGMVPDGAGFWNSRARFLAVTLNEPESHYRVSNRGMKGVNLNL